MKNRVVWLMAALVIGFVASGPSQAQQITNLIPNGGFETGVISPWGSYANNTGVRTQAVVKDCVGATVPEGPIEGNYCLNVNVTALATEWWDIGLQPRGIVFAKGKKYTLSVFLKCKTGTLQVNMKPELAATPYTGYGAAVVTMTEKWAEYHVTTPVFADDVTPAGVTFHIGFAKAEFWVDDAKWYEGDYVPTVTKNKLGALSPTPDSKAVDIPRDPTLSWKAGPFAKTHNVYLGTSFDDVNTADLTKAVSKGQAGTTFEPAGLLEYGKTYYWRVDEVNAPPSTAVFKGDVWSFTVENYAYPITGVTATASSSDKTTTGPANTVNGSGLTNDLHSTASDAMWVSSMTGAQPTWIRYAFDKAYKLRELWVWNHNTEFEPILGYGFKDVTVEYSTDGTTWKTLKDVQFAQATALAGYAHNTTVDLGGVMAQYVRLTAKSNWSLVGLKQYGLSEVRFYYVPVEARAPQPGDYAAGVSVGAALDWRPGREAASHKVSFGTDKAAVAAGTAAAKTVTDHSFAPSGLDFGTTYYWKVDEVNGVNSYAGSIWSFTTQPYAVVEDFESYTDKEGSLLYEAWIDGLTNSTGSFVGYINPSGGTFGETVIVHGGKQSMPFEYNNVASPFYSEADRTFDTPQDWTTNGADSLALWYRGYPAAFTETASGITLSGAGADIYQGTAEFRFAYKQLTGDGSITVRVDSAQTLTNWTKSGVMMRQTLDPLALQVHMISAARQSLVEWMYRSATNSTTTTQFNTAAGTNPLPVWLRITRAGNVFTGECSADGKTWTEIASGGTSSSTTLNMSATIYIGMVVCSNSAGNVAVADFSQIKTTGNVTAQWQTADVGVTQVSNGAAPLYVTVEDKASKKKTVVNPDPAAVNKSVWTEWRIALSDLTGINPAAVKKLTLGVGDRASPKAGAAGMLYLDDIGFGKPILPVGLVANYTLENNVNDVTGNAHDGTIVGTPTFVAGPAGKGTAIQFTGAVGPYVDLGTFNPSEKTGMLSVSLWAKWNGLSGLYQGLIAKRNSWANAQMMWQIEAAQANGAITFSREGSYPASGNPILKVGEWTHIALTFDKTTARFYVNGVQTGQGAFSFGSNRDATLHIGCCDAGGGNPFNGAIDEVRLYDVVLTPAEVLALAGK